MSLERIQQARPTTAIVLGSGLGTVVDAFGMECEVPYSAIPALGQTTVPGHAGRLVLTTIAGQPVLFAQGRRHLYEGLSAVETTAGIRLMHELGVRRLILTNAAGTLHLEHAPGGLMLITDHLNLTGTSPLIGGPHFHDMSAIYCPEWRQQFLTAATALSLPLHQGVYAALIGPQYETPAEIRMLRLLGADAVGMSTALEAIQARALGMQVAGVSMLTNWAAGINATALDHTEVVRMGQTVASTLARLLQAVLQLPSSR